MSRESETATFGERLAEAMKTVKFYDPAKRPKGFDADEWLVFIEEHYERKEFLAVQVAQALEAAEQRYLSAVKGRQEFRRLYMEARDTISDWQEGI